MIYHKYPDEADSPPPIIVVGDWYAFAIEKYHKAELGPPPVMWDDVVIAPKDLTEWSD